MLRRWNFMVNGKMYISISNDNLLCRFDYMLQHEVESRDGFQLMIMKGQKLKGYCIINA